MMETMRDTLTEIDPAAVREFREKRISFTQLIESQLDDDTRKLINSRTSPNLEIDFGYGLVTHEEHCSRIKTAADAQFNLNHIRSYIQNAQQCIELAKALEIYYAKTLAAFNCFTVLPVVYLNRCEVKYYGSPTKIVYDVYDGDYIVETDHFTMKHTAFRTFEGKQRIEAARFVQQRTESIPMAKGFRIDNGYTSNINYDRPDWESKV